MAPWSRFAAPIYQNIGSVARDHLASERTFLAWIRTGLGFVALGIAIERVSRLDLTELMPEQNRPPRTAEERLEKELDKERSQMLVGTLMGLGSGSIMYGTARYFSGLRHLERGNFRPAYYGAAILGATVAGLAGGVYGTALRRRKGERAEQTEM
ncbi:putative membrane protein [Microdochium nivale]|nr:putative membrane protein [Microdochium nivale]